MKEIRITLEDNEYKTLSKKKGDRTWKQVLINGGGKDDRESNLSESANTQC